MTINSIFWQRENTYTENQIFLSDEEMTNTEINIGDYNLKFAIGLDSKDMGDDFDVLNNPYVQIVGYNWHIMLGLQYYMDLEICSEEFLEDFI